MVNGDRTLGGMSIRWIAKNKPAPEVPLDKPRLEHLFRMTSIVSMCVRTQRLSTLATILLILLSCVGCGKRPQGFGHDAAVVENVVLVTAFPSGRPIGYEDVSQDREGSVKGARFLRGLRTLDRSLPVPADRIGQTRRYESIPRDRKRGPRLPSAP